MPCFHARLFLLVSSILHTPGLTLQGLSPTACSFMITVPTFLSRTQASSSRALVTGAGAYAALKRKSAQVSVIPTLFLSVPLLHGKGREFFYHSVYNQSALHKIFSCDKLLMRMDLLHAGRKIQGNDILLTEHVRIRTSPCDDMFRLYSAAFEHLVSKCKKWLVRDDPE